MGRLLCGIYRVTSRRHNDIHVRMHQLGGERANSVQLSFGVIAVYRNVFILAPAKLLKATPESSDALQVFGIGRRQSLQDADLADPIYPLRTRRFGHCW